MDPLEEEKNNLEPVLENLLVSQNETGSETNRLLETIIEQGEKNNNGSALEGSLMLLNDIKNKPGTKFSIEVVGAKETIIEGPKGDAGAEGKPGKDGKTPVKGRDYFTPDEVDKIIAAVRAEIPDPVDGKTPVKGQDYFTDEDIAILLKEIAPFLPRGPKGMKGDKGDEPDYDVIVKSVLEKVPKPKDGKDGSPDSPKDIVEKLESLKKNERLSYSALKDTPPERGPWGSGPTFAVKNEGTVISTAVKYINFVGANVDVTDLGDGEIVVTFAGGGGSANVATEVVTAVQAGDNVTIDLTQLDNPYSAIQWVSRNGQILIPGNTSFGWTQTGDIVTVYGASSDESFQVSYTY